MEKINSQTLCFLQELALFYFVLLTELDKLLCHLHSGKFEDQIVRFFV